MLGTCLTATIVVVELAAMTYTLNKQGVFDDIKAKFIKPQHTTTTVDQPNLKCIAYRYTKI